jgi:F-type H+-transporting ATPase subunit c
MKKYFLSVVFIIFAVLSHGTATAGEVKKELNVKNNENSKQIESKKIQNSKIQKKSEKTDSNKFWYIITIMVVITLLGSIAIFAQSFVGGKALNGIARNPESASAVQKIHFLTLALIESIVVYAVVIVFMILFMKL